MIKIQSISQGLSNAFSSIMSVLKVAILSRRIQSYDVQSPKGAKPLIILGNGPSLRQNIDQDINLIKQADSLAVNFAANTEDFRQLSPDYYVLADPHFFDNPTDINVDKLIKNLNNVDWSMTLFVPVKALKTMRKFICNPLITIKGFNLTPIEGAEVVTNFLLKHKAGMPRPRNVLIPSIMIGIWLGYHKIILLGADHSWLSTLSVDADNHVVSVQPHFYKENPQELERITRVYDSRKLHEVLQSMCIAFKSYHVINRFANTKSIEIINATPASMIDAFYRTTLADAI